MRNHADILWLNELRKNLSSYTKPMVPIRQDFFDLDDDDLTTQEERLSNKEVA